MTASTRIYHNGRPVSNTNRLPVDADIVLGDTTINTTGLASEAKQDTTITRLQSVEADIEAGNVSLAALVSGQAAQATAANQATANTRLQEISTALAAVATESGQSALADLLTSIYNDLNSKANANETQPVTLANTTVPLPTGASTETTLNALYSAIGQTSAAVWNFSDNASLIMLAKSIARALGISSAAAWSGTGNGTVIEIAKAIHDVLKAPLTTDLADAGGTAIGSENPLHVVQAQLLASQDSVQANQYGLGSNSTYIPVRVPDRHAFNVSGASVAANGQSTLLAAAGVGLKNYVHHVRISAQAVGATPTNSRMSILDGTSGTVLDRFRIEAGEFIDLWYPNGTLVSSANTLLSLRNDDDEALANLEWGVDYAIGA